MWILWLYLISTLFVLVGTMFWYRVIKPNSKQASLNVILITTLWPLIGPIFIGIELGERGFRILQKFLREDV